LKLRTTINRLLGTALLLGVAYTLYPLFTAEERMTAVCRHITPGMTVDALRSYAQQHGLGPLRNLNAQTQSLYLAESRSMGRHSCRVELANGKVTQASYSFAD
jgi:hypothetical protein